MKNDFYVRNTDLKIYPIMLLHNFCVCLVVPTGQNIVHILRTIAPTLMELSAKHISDCFTKQTSNPQFDIRLISLDRITYECALLGNIHIAQ